MTKTRSTAEINALMAKHVPELASCYATYPLKEEQWYGANHKGKKGEPCFLSAPTNEGLKIDYVWGGKGPLGPGYYSLLTKPAYVNLYSRVNSEGPGACCCGAPSAESRRTVAEWDDVKTIVYGRYVSPQPDDAVAAKAVERESRSTAVAHHLYGGN